MMKTVFTWNCLLVLMIGCQLSLNSMTVAEDVEPKHPRHLQQDQVEKSAPPDGEIERGVDDPFCAPLLKVRLNSHFSSQADPHSARRASLPDSKEGAETISGKGTMDSANPSRDQAGAEEATVDPAELRMVAWNVESEGNWPDEIAYQLQKMDNYHLFALSEVARGNARRYADAIGHGESTFYRFLHSQTGRDDQLALVFDSSRLRLIQSLELFAHDDLELNDWEHRSPLVAQFEDRVTGVSFLVMVNHLARRDAKMREEQATGIREWAARQTLPVIALGDFNFDWAFENRQGNPAFHAFMKNDVWKWIEPDELIDTNWSDRDGDGNDDYPGSMLDFAFVSGAARQWEARCRVLVRGRDFPDNEKTSDHRPIELTITPRS